jgi:dTDP-glucose 4,6-dehydratase
MTWQDRSVLVTGAGGFIASHLAERLVREGARVRALVHYNALASHGWLDSSPLAADMEIVRGDVQDAEFVARATEGVVVVFHLAALIGIPYSYVAPSSYVATNVGGTLNVLQAARRAGGVRVVHASSSEVYGTAVSVPMTETHPLQAQSPYAATKIAADKLAESFHLSFGLPVVTVRPFNTYGPRQSTRAVVPTIISQCLAGGPIRLGSLTPVRDLNFVDDTVDGFVRAGAVAEAAGHVLHLGSGCGISIGDLVRVIARILGVEPTIEQEEERVRPTNSEVERLLADASRACAILGWRSRVPLEEGLLRTIDWMSRHRDTAKSHAYGI